MFYSIWRKANHVRHGTLQEVDFAVAKFTVTEIRDTVIDFATPFWHEPAVIVMKKPQDEHLYSYLGPFRYN